MRFGRFVDADVDTNLTGDFTNDFLTTRRTAEAFRSCFAAEAGTLKLTNQTNAAISPSIGAFAGETAGSCVDGTAASPATGDLDMKLIWFVPRINPGKSVSTTFFYYAN